jgi:hypothetical protein
MPFTPFKVFEIFPKLILPFSLEYIKSSILPRILFTIGLLLPQLQEDKLSSSTLSPISYLISGVP